MRAARNRRSPRYREPEQVLDSMRTEVTRSVPPPIPVPMLIDEPAPDPLPVDPLAADPLAVDPPDPERADDPEPDPPLFCMRPRISTRWPTCCFRLLPLSMMVSLPAEEEPAPLPAVEPAVDPLVPVPEPDALVPAPPPDHDTLVRTYCELPLLDRGFDLLPVPPDAVDPDPPAAELPVAAPLVPLVP